MRGPLAAARTRSPDRSLSISPGCHEAYDPGDINYGKEVPEALVVFVIVLSYAVVAPSILPFGAAYFALAYIIFRNQARTQLRRACTSLCRLSVSHLAAATVRVHPQLRGRRAAVAPRVCLHARGPGHRPAHASRRAGAQTSVCALLLVAGRCERSFANAHAWADRPRPPLPSLRSS